jgi:hypothetical protein
MFLLSAESVLPLFLLVTASNGVPTIDVENTCRLIQKNVASMVQNDFDPFALCVRQQREAQDKLQSNWAAFPPADRRQCVNTTGYAPNYVEWLSCLETSAAVRRIRNKSN